MGIIVIGNRIKLGSKLGLSSHAPKRITEGFGVISNGKLRAGRDNSIPSFPNCGGLTYPWDALLDCRLE